MSFTVIIYFSEVKDVDIEAMELENEGKQCVVASIDFDVFPMSYTFKGTACNETHHVICQKFHGMHILFIFWLYFDSSFGSKIVWW